MVQRQLVLSDDADQFIQRQLATGQFTTPDEVVSKTLEAAQVAAAQKKLAALIREGLESKGEDIEFTEEWYDKRMDEVKAEFERSRTPCSGSSFSRRRPIWTSWGITFTCLVEMSKLRTDSNDR